MSQNMMNKLVDTPPNSKLPNLALKVLSKQNFATHIFQSGDIMKARNILIKNRKQINTDFLDIKKIRSRVISIFQLSQAFYKISRYNETWDLLNATQLLLDKVPDTQENLSELKKDILFQLILTYKNIHKLSKMGKTTIKNINSEQILNTIKKVVLKMNRLYSSFESEFIDSELDIHKLAMYNLEVGLKVKFEDYMAKIEDTGDERSLSIASDYWFLSAQQYLDFE
ncbi:MAG: hypothetical protein COB02_07635 [Candidatus Cloacimonadota bacterium]|nr:MAG: hypothetical protein COB02_07635 [Candidatus Cloacimonadota bacterium]